MRFKCMMVHQEGPMTREQTLAVLFEDEEEGSGSYFDACDISRGASVEDVCRALHQLANQIENHYSKGSGG